MIVELCNNRINDMSKQTYLVPSCTQITILCRLCILPVTPIGILHSFEQQLQRP